eukprot:7918243-Pyramimonas_sp.AAC.2
MSASHYLRDGKAARVYTFWGDDQRRRCRGGSLERGPLTGTQSIGVLNRTRNTRGLGRKTQSPLKPEALTEALRRYFQARHTHAVEGKDYDPGNKCATDRSL